MDYRNARLTKAVGLFCAVTLLSLPFLANAESKSEFAAGTISTGQAGLLDFTQPEEDVLGPLVPDVAAADETTLPDAPQATASQSAPATPASTVDPTANTGQQTKRILFIIPNFRAASVDAKLPPMTAKQEIKLVFQDSFDYSNFIYVGIVAGIGQAENSYPVFGQGGAGYGRYYWHSFADSVSENAFTEFIVPYVAREDPRYYTLGRGGFSKRLVYSVSRLAITRSNSGGETVNLSEIVGAGAAAGVSNLYYPSIYTNWTKTGQKWLLQLAVDGLGNVAKEFWPDVNAAVFKNKL